MGGLLSFLDDGAFREGCGDSVEVKRGSQETKQNETKKCLIIGLALTSQKSKSNINENV